MSGYFGRFGAFRNSFTRWNRSWILRLAIIGVLLVPLIYGGVLLWAYWNPAGNINNLPAAIVNEDVPIELSGHTINAGEQLTEKVVAGQELKWTETDMDAAQQGLESGQYYLILAVPSDFSSQLGTLDTANPQQAQLQVITNDATNYLVDEISSAVLAGIQGQATQELQYEFLDVVYSAMGTLKKDGTKLVNGADKLSDGAKEAASGAQQLSSGAQQVADGNKQVAQAGTELADAVQGLPEAANQLATTADTVSSDAQQVENQAATVDENLADVESKLEQRGLTDLAQVVADARSAYDDAVLTPTKDIADLTNRAATIANDAAEQSKNVVSEANDAASKLNELSQGADEVASGASKLSDALTDELAPGAQKLSKALNRAAAAVPPITDAQKGAFTQVLSEPVVVEQTRQNEVETFGDGFAAYFLPLALYVGAMFLLLMIPPLNERLLHFGSPVKAAIGSFAPLASFGAMASIVMLGGVVGLVGVRASAYLPLLIVCLISMWCYLALVQLLKAALGVVGSFLAVVLLVLQVAGDAGAYPIETFNKFFNLIHPILPMTYSVDGIRRSIAGGPLWGYVGTDLLVLVGMTLLFLAGAVFVSWKRKVVSADFMHPEVEIK